MEHLVTRPAAAEPAIRTGGTFSALRHRDFRLLWLGLVVSNVGSWMQMVAQGWLVYLLTDSPFYLGLVGFMRAIPVFSLSLFAGVVADRFDRRRVLLLTQAASMLLSLALATLVALGVVAVWHVLVIAFLSAAVFSFDTPSRQSLIPDLVGREDLVNAIGLQSAAFNLAGVIGPALAAVVIDNFGIAATFYLNSASFLAVLAALLAMSPRGPGARIQGQSLVRNLLEGLNFVRREPAILGLVVILMALSLLGRPYIQLLPVFARDVLAVGAGGLGALNALSGVGALLGALAVATLGSFRRRGLVLEAAVVVFAVALVAFAGSTTYALSLLLSMVLGFTTTFYQASSNTMLQIQSPPALRGRVVSIYTLIMMGFMPLGSMVLGSLGELFGVPLTLAAAGLIVLAVAVVVSAAVPRLRTME